MSEGPSWVAVLPADEVEPNGVTLVRAAGRDYVVYDAPDGLYASLAYCTHAGALLRDGYFDRHLIECPLHQGCFDIRTGKALNAPVTVDITSYPVRVEGEDVLVEFEPGRTPGYFTLARIAWELSPLLDGHEIDIRTPNGLSPYFRDEVISSAYPVYGYG